MEKVIAGSLPKYRQLLQLLRTQILSGELPSGARLPTEEDLSRTYGLSRGTVRKAIEQLGAEGLVRTEQGSGSYVSSAHPNAVPFRFTRCPPADSPTFRVITKEVIPATMVVAERLIVPLGEPLIHIARLRLQDEEIVGYSERFLPRSLCPDLLEEDLEQPSIHDILVSRSELPLLRATLEIEAQLLDEEGAKRLRVPPATPAIVISRMTYTAPNRPAVWYRGLYRQAYCVSVRVDALDAESAVAAPTPLDTE
jgi:DNA-binding GntR family transcriptional regulator